MAPSPLFLNAEVEDMCKRFLTNPVIEDLAMSNASPQVIDSMHSDKDRISAVDVVMGRADRKRSYLDI
jgi:hypothetical protein